MSAESQSARQIARLRWRCRRGMRELDMMLTAYLEQHFLQSKPDLQFAFERLLDVEDDLLWDWLSGQKPPADGSLAEVVVRVRQQHPA